MLNEVRIIAGKWRGRKIQFPTVAGLRPTPNRIRETLFNWLAPYIHDARCLDLFTGSGALGFESLSRGAAYVLCLEKDREAYQMLRINAERLNADAMEIKEKDALVWLTTPPPQASKMPTPFDIIFVDPPYALNALSKCFAFLESQAWFTINTLIYFESDVPIELLALPDTWEILKKKKAGNVYYYLTQKTRGSA
ncbi:MAG TPA: 16S rRNA (guanine(966)-N(2))-methyltransferase RsmD [Gammaproteobacteria bacterium]|nr:16S rRNA (guanine(966)-N(2))-methyltransferase RsmD [Gammaproteobacteria bacterium]